jgi:hypothetical protein
MMENIYFDGLKDVNSTLLGLVLIGDIPLPVINQEGYIYPSIYPYVDFIHQKYIRNPIDKYFVPDENPNGEAEIWHGLINYGADIQAYHDFFEKIKTYKADPSSFIDEFVWYEDFIANKEKFIESNLPFYQNSMIFGEDISYQRYHELLLKLFKGDKEADMEKLVGSLSTELVGRGGEGLQSEYGDIPIDQEGVSTQITERSTQEGFLIQYPELFSAQNGVSRRDNVLAGGRWIKTYTEKDTGQANLEAKADSSIDRIHLKDTLNLGNEDINGLLVNFNTLLEKAIDTKIETENYDMDLVIPTEYRREEFKKKSGKCLRNPYQYQVYYFGTNARLLQEAKGFSIYRGTFRNIGTLEEASISAFNASANPMTSAEDPTPLLYKNLSASYDAFSTQVEANKGYDFLYAMEEIDTYERNKISTKFDDKCKSWIIKNLFCRKYERQRKGKCTPGNFLREIGPAPQKYNTLQQASLLKQGIKVEDDIMYQIIQETPTTKKQPSEERYTDDDEDCEDVEEFSQRRRGGASPTQIDTDLLSGDNAGVYQLKKFQRRNARRTIYDIGGSKALNGAQPNANNFKAMAGRRGGWSAVEKLENYIQELKGYINKYKGGIRDLYIKLLAQTQPQLDALYAASKLEIENQGFASPTSTLRTFKKSTRLGLSSAFVTVIEPDPTYHIPFTGIDYFSIDTGVLEYPLTIHSSLNAGSYFEFQNTTKGGCTKKEKSLIKVDIPDLIK